MGLDQDAEPGDRADLDAVAVQVVQIKGALAVVPGLNVGGLDALGGEVLVGAAVEKGAMARSKVRAG